MAIHLDYNLQTAAERTLYTNSISEELKKASHSDLEKAADYILWATTTNSTITTPPTTHKPHSESKAAKARLYGLKTQYKTSTHETHSLEALCENPTFQESSISAIGENRLKVPHPNFNREEIINDPSCPSYILDEFKTLWSKIDELEAALNKTTTTTKDTDFNGPSTLRKVPETLSGLSSEFQTNKIKEHLHDLREYQYILKDFYRPQIFIKESGSINGEPLHINLNAATCVGLMDFTTTSRKLFTKHPLPQAFTEEELWALTNRLYQTTTSQDNTIDITDSNTIIQIINNWRDFKVDAPQELLDTMRFYFLEFADLTETQINILKLRLAGASNKIIRDFVNKKYNHNYGENYISTIITHQITKKIIEGIQLHRKIAENLMFPENFKKCSKCGEMLLISEEYFGRRKDSYLSRCKKCNKK